MKDIREYLVETRHAASLPTTRTRRKPSRYFVGSIRALNVSDQGGYPVHYDIQLNRRSGAIGVMVATAYSRKKM
jgi:hypothetical protein